MKKNFLQIIGLLLSCLSCFYFVVYIYMSIWLDKTEYDRFYLDILYKPFVLVHSIFIGLFILSFFFKKYTKYLLILLVISVTSMYLINHHYWSVLNHGQGA